MTFKEMVFHYYPYWIMGIVMIISTLFSEHKDLMRIQPKSLLEFGKRMVTITILRSVFMYFFPPSIQSVAPILHLPVWVTFQVFWEDPLFTLPLALSAIYLGSSKLGKLIQYGLTGLMMVSFGLGHLYQGILSACLISLYIPVVSKLGVKHGFGTVILCHIAYDFITIMTVKTVLGL